MTKRLSRIQAGLLQRAWPSPRGHRPGFTLTELLVVMVIIGIIVSFILKVSFDGVRRANEVATLGLIQKLDMAMSERMEALMTVDVQYNAAHDYIARLYNKQYATGLANPDRARVIALYDFIKSEVPDVFVLWADPSTIDPTSTTVFKDIYPFQFAAEPYPFGTVGTWSPGTTSNYATYAQYLLPLGAGVVNDGSTTFGAFDITNPTGTGIFGASYSAAAGLYKNLGYYPTGYDGVDNDLDGLIDEMDEGVNTANSKAVLTRLQAHTHKTARSEMLYAILVEGQGPLGASFAADDFTSREVADTDGDGLPEFIDAWGEPLQFYRWPIFHHSAVQRGYPNWDQIQQNIMYPTAVSAGTSPLPVLSPYNGAFDDREVSPFDPNQQIVNPGWLFSTTDSLVANDSAYTPSNWFTGATVDPSGSKYPVSAGAIAFQTYFHTLFEPWVASPVISSTSGFPNNSPPMSWTWDRSNTSPYILRRSYFTKFLIASSGPDKSMGIGRLGYASESEIGSGTQTASGLQNILGVASAQQIQNVIQIENTAAAIDPHTSQWISIDANGLCLLPVSPAASSTNGVVTTFTNPNSTTLYLQQQAALDDISNHALQASAGSNP